jgi:hypothetical protein
MAGDMDWIDADATPLAERPHDFESEHGAAEGGVGPCAVCGQSRGNAVHAPLPAFSKIMNEMLK